MGIRENQKQLRYQAILEAGLDAFIAKGYSGTRISDIAERAHMSIGLLFHYFENTEKLFEALVTIGIQGTQQFLPESLPINAPAFFETYTQSLFQEIQKNSFTAKMFLLMGMAMQNSDIPSSVKHSLTQIRTVTVFSDIIRLGQEQDQMKKGNSHVLANTFLVCLVGLVRQYALDPTTPLPDPSWVVDIIRKRG